MKRCRGMAWFAQGWQQKLRNNMLKAFIRCLCCYVWAHWIFFKLLVQYVFKHIFVERSFNHVLVSVFYYDNCFDFVSINLDEPTEYGFEVAVRERWSKNEDWTNLQETQCRNEGNLISTSKICKNNFGSGNFLICTSLSFFFLSRTSLHEFFRRSTLFRQRPPSSYPPSFKVEGGGGK